MARQQLEKVKSGVGNVWKVTSPSTKPPWHTEVGQSSPNTTHTDALQHSSFKNSQYFNDFLLAQASLLLSAHQWKDGIRLDFYWQSAHALHVCSVNTHDELNPNGTAWKQCENQKTQWHCMKTMHVYWSALQSKSIWQSVRAMHVCWQSQQSKSPWQTMKARHARWPIQLIAKQNLCVVIKSTLIT